MYLNTAQRYLTLSAASVAPAMQAHGRLSVAVLTSTRFAKHVLNVPLASIPASLALSLVTRSVTFAPRVLKGSTNPQHAPPLRIGCVVSVPQEIALRGNMNLAPAQRRPTEFAPHVPPAVAIRTRPLLAQQTATPCVRPAQHALAPNMNLQPVELVSG
jgi:hypothetical protein